MDIYQCNTLGADNKIEKKAKFSKKTRVIYLELQYYF
jgi:hypothetical protein